MKITNCLHPQRIYNKYLGQYMYVPCGKCSSCRNIQSYKWISRLQQESQLHKYTVFFTLTYDDDCIPKFVKYDDNMLVSSPRLYRYLSTNGSLCEKYVYDGLCIDVKDLPFDSERDRLYFDRYNTFTYPCVLDIQHFIKRLRYRIYELFKKASQEEASAQSGDKRLRYYIVSEFSPRNHRCHYHGQLFFSSPEVAKNIKEFILQSWLLCDRRNINVQFSDSGSASYVAKYVTKSIDLPSFFRYGDFRPFALSSRQPFIGHDSLSQEQIKQIITSSDVCHVEWNYQSKEVYLTRNNSSFERRYFPRCYGFGLLSDRARILLYSVVSRTKAFSFSAFKSYIRLITVDDVIQSDVADVMRWVVDRVKRFVPSDQFDVSLDNLLYRIYCTSRHVEYMANVFGIEFDQYIQYILNYYQELSRYNLNEQYKFMIEYVEQYDPQDKFNVDDLDLLFPDQCLDYIENLSDNEAYVRLKSLTDKMDKDASDNKKRKDYHRDKKLSALPHRVY